jgi:hypothetical protein
MASKTRANDTGLSLHSRLINHVAASGGGYLLVSGAFAGSDFSTLGELVVVVGNPKHNVSSRALSHCSSKGTHFLTSLPSMIRVIG